MVRLNLARKTLWPSFGTATDKGCRARGQAWGSTKTVPKANPSKQAVYGRKTPRLNLAELWQCLTGPEDRPGKGPKQDPEANPCKQRTRAWQGERSFLWQKVHEKGVRLRRLLRRGLAKVLAKALARACCLAMASCGKCLAMAHPSQAPAPAEHGVGGFSHTK